MMLVTWAAACGDPSGVPDSKDSAAPDSRDTNGGESGDTADTSETTDSDDTTEPAETGDTGRLEVRSEAFWATIGGVSDRGATSPGLSATVWAGRQAVVAPGYHHRLELLPGPLAGNVDPASLSGASSTNAVWDTWGIAEWVVGDLDGNESPDLGAVNGGEGTVTVWRDAFAVPGAAPEPSVEWTTEGCLCYGWNVVSADLDGDGVEEVVSAVDGAHGFAAATAVGSYSFDESAWWIRSDDASWNGFTEPTVAAQDLDGDGLADLLAGAWRALDDDTYDTRVFLGPLDGEHASSSADVVLDLPGDTAPVSLPVFGDVDGDGTSDIILGVGGDQLDTTYSPVRTTWALPLPSSGAASVEDLAIATFTSEDEEMEDDWGTSLAAGDMDGDGLAELALGIDGVASKEDGVGNGRVYLYVGPLLGAYTPDTATARISEDEYSNSRFGATLAMADVSTPAGTELIVSAYDADIPDQPNAGAIYVIPVFW